MASVNPRSSGLSELWSRLRFVLLALIIYRIGTHIPIPGIDPVKISSLFDQNQGRNFYRIYSRNGDMCTYSINNQCKKNES
jgi:preprotein translocase subunit SecY